VKSLNIGLSAGRIELVELAAFVGLSAANADAAEVVRIDDAFRAVPRSLREGAYALSATRLEVSTRVVLPAALSGVVAAVILAFARAIGETMAVTLAAGAMPRLTLNPLVSIQTMTSYIVQVSLGDTPHGTIEYQTIFAVGMLLFLITLAFNVTAQRVLRRFREAYE